MLGQLLLPLALVMILGALALEQRVMNDHHSGVTMDEDVVADGFLSYKRAVQAYVHESPGITGSISLASLPTADITGATSAMHSIVQRSAAGTTIQTWWDGAGSARLAALQRLSEGDIAIGLSNGSTWQSPAGGQMGALPVAVAAGDVVSVVTFTGTGF
ncbi:type IV pilus biogenesis protein PilM [Gluconacetobacter sacchari]|uniref:Type IV pilus biogenesis protein PilM n=1 Tax=Gluconacetobacter sacchari TaxID=92759 RepID=A0A7W4IEV6_9PROT|nr:type IV pilus biogenesis protein PilM [Gluconacetobacter sacchari]MBB2161585.1 type IV pilus biogenesis protein PilM [Gluconacetobacter sacchari]